MRQVSCISKMINFIIKQKTGENPPVLSVFIKATPHNYRLTPLSFTRLIFFRHNIQNSLEIHTVFLRSFCLF